MGFHGIYCTPLFMSSPTIGLNTPNNSICEDPLPYSLFSVPIILRYNNSFQYVTPYLTYWLANTLRLTLLYSPRCFFS